MGLFFLVLVCLFVCFCFLEIFATSAFCPKLPKTNGANEENNATGSIGGWDIGLFFERFVD
jgi:hypothetical protein